jgi:hypothetical protein
MSSISLLRWVLKKTARTGVVLLSLLSGRVDFRQKVLADSQVRVLTYHRFGSVPRDPFCVDLKDFDAQMAWLASQQRAISLSDLENFLSGKQDLPNGSVLVTIDDGYQSIYSGALPILQKYGIPCVLFLTVSAIHETAPDGFNTRGTRTPPHVVRSSIFRSGWLHDRFPWLDSPLLRSDVVGRGAGGSHLFSANFREACTRADDSVCLSLWYHG